jgi:anti-sigma factor RsiW
MPDLSPVGLKLVGGTDSALRYNDDGQVGALSWADGDVAYVVNGGADRERLHKVAETVYAQIERPSGR